MKPCELPCPKCGATDIHRQYRARWSDWQAEKYGGYSSKYASNHGSYRMHAHKEHIEHHCRTCQHDWQTPPLKKRGPKGSVPSATAQDAGAVTGKPDPHQSIPS